MFEAQSSCPHSRGPRDTLLFDMAVFAGRQTEILAGYADYRDVLWKMETFQRPDALFEGELRKVVFVYTNFNLRRVLAAFYL